MMKVRLCKKCRKPIKEARNAWHNRVVCLDCECKIYHVRKVLAQKAHYWAQYAQKKGLIPKLDGSVPCMDCGHPAWVYDHRDYRKPKDVEPVCSGCNKNRGPALPMVSQCRLAKRIRYRYQKERNKKMQCADTLPLT